MTSTNKYGARDCTPIDLCEEHGCEDECLCPYDCVRRDHRALFEAQASRLPEYLQGP